MVKLPTLKLTIDHMEGLGYRADQAERHIRGRNVSHDLFGIIDVVAVGHGETVGIQTTSRPNVSARVRKMAESDAIGDLRDAGWRLLVHGWRKDGPGEYSVRVVDLS